MSRCTVMFSSLDSTLARSFPGARVVSLCVTIRPNGTSRKQTGFTKTYLLRHETDRGDEASFHAQMRRNGWSTPGEWQAELVDVSNLKKAQRCSDVRVDQCRCVFEVGVARSAEEQIGVGTRERV